MAKYRILEIVKEKCTIYKVQKKFLWWWFEQKFTTYDYDYKGRLKIHYNVIFSFFVLATANEAIQMLKTKGYTYKNNPIYVVFNEVTLKAHFYLPLNGKVFSTLIEAEKYIDTRIKANSNKTLKVNIITN